MDWRKRKYYLVKISSEAREMRDKNLKGISKYVEFHPPYSHFAEGKYDGCFHRITEIVSPSYMLSCRKEDAEAVEYELRKAVRNDMNSKFCRLSKDACGQ